MHASTLLLHQAQSWLRQGRPDQALATCALLLQMKPGHAEALALRQQALMQRAGQLEALGHTAAAAEAFLVATRAAPELALAWEGAARQLYRLNRLTEAEQAQQRACALDPSLWADGRIGHVRCHAKRAALLDAATLAACGPGEACADAASLQAAVAARELVVLDDFLPDPLAWRAHALALPFDKPRGDQVNYPGVQTLGQAVEPAWLQRMADALGRDLKWAWPGHGAFRLSPAGSLARSDIHTDLDQGAAYAGVLYLSLPEHCQGGTSFWRQRGTGWVQQPSAAQLAASAWPSREAFNASLSAPAPAGSGHEELAQLRAGWELVFEVGMRFNRLILYRADFFHAVSQVFGQRADDARLVQLFFFEPLGSPTS